MIKTKIIISLLDKLLIFTTLPVWIVSLGLISLLKLTIDGRPVFYTSARYSSLENHFIVLKFRTMKNDQKMIDTEVSKYSNGGYQYIPLESNLYTSFGRFLERTQLVELPQIINCIKYQITT